VTIDNFQCNIHKNNEYEVNTHFAG